MDVLWLEQRRAAVRQQINDRPVFDLRQESVPECACCAIDVYGLHAQNGDGNPGMENTEVTKEEGKAEIQGGKVERL